MTKRILIAGVPATGKTTIGNYLRDNSNFRHFDVESEESNPNINQLGKLFWGLEVDKFLEQVEENGKNIVITWGFVCDHPHSLNIIKALQEKGFEFIWFYADEPIARFAFLRRGTGDIQDFDIQMERIKKLDLAIFNKPTIITTLDKNGRKNKDEIIKRILEG
jgi:adenylate kinase family enzyme